MPFDLNLNRRSALHLLAGGAAFAAGVTPGSTAEARIDRLIKEARDKGPISKRLDFISGALRGTRYQGYTLIGGPRRPEKFVVRDDAFDCVTFCETVLAAAIANNRRIRSSSAQRPLSRRYGRPGVSVIIISSNGASTMSRTRPAAGSTLEGARRYRKDRSIGKRARHAAHFAMRVIPQCRFSRRQRQARKWRHRRLCDAAAGSRLFPCRVCCFRQSGRVAAAARVAKPRIACWTKRMDRFVAVNRVRYVTLLRPQEPHAIAGNE